LTFNRPDSNERISVLWNETTEIHTLTWPAVGENGQLIAMDGDVMVEPDEQGNFIIPLPPAQPDIDQSASPNGGVAIGGAPYILIERIGGQVDPVVINFDGPASVQVVAEPTPSSSVTANSAPTSAPRPTIDPARDSSSPTATVLPLPAISPPTFTVTWNGQDDSGIARYLIWVRVNGGEWTPWLETSESSADYIGIPGNSYEFSAWAVDLADNWTEGTQITAQASTRVE